MSKPIVFLTMLLLLTATRLPAEVLPLDDALRKSATGNRGLIVTAYDEQVAEENVRLSQTALLPRIDVQGGFTAQLEPQSINTFAGSFTTQQADFAFFSLGIYYNLYDFGRTNARIQKAKAQRDSTSFAYKERQQDIFLQVVTAYFRILQTESLLRYAVEEVKQMEDHLRIAQNLFEEGVVTRNDLLQAEVGLASSRQHHLDMRNKVQNWWLRLNYLIGAPASFRADLVADTRFDPVSPETALNDVVAGRPEIQAQKRLLQAGDLDVREAGSNLLPEVFVKAGMDYVQNDRVKEQALFAATIGLKANIFEGGAAVRRREVAVKNRQRMSEQLRQLEEEIAVEYLTAVNDANVAADRISVTEASIRQGEENLRINRDRYIEQVGTATTVVDAQALLTRIRTENAQAVFDYELAIARVKRARGEL